MHNDLLLAVTITALGVWVGWLWGRRSGRKSAMTATDLAVAVAAPEALYEIDELSCIVEFDNNGDGLYTRREMGIRPKFDVAELIIPYRFNVTPQGSLEPPRVTARSREVVEFSPSTSEPTRLTGSVRLTGPFKRGTNIEGYTLEQRFKKAFLMTKKEVLEAYRDSPMQREYFGIATHVPAKILRCIVKFPDSHRTFSEAPSPCAFIGETELINDLETARVAVWFSRSDNTAELSVERPRSGMRYAIVWLAPERSLTPE